MPERNTSSDLLPEPVEKALAAVARLEPSAGFTRAVLARVRSTQASTPVGRASDWRLAVAAAALVALVSAGLLWRAGPASEPILRQERASAGRESSGSSVSGPALPGADEPAAVRTAVQTRRRADGREGWHATRAEREPATDVLEVPPLPGPEPIEVGAIEIDALVPDPLAIEPLVIPEVDIERASRTPGSR